MCYGDPDHNTDGEYRRYLEDSQRQQDERRQEEDQRRQERDRGE